MRRGNCKTIVQAAKCRPREEAIAECHEADWDESLKIASRIMETIAVLLAVLLSGCITIEQTIKIRSDDTLVANYSYSFSSHQREAVKAAATSFSPYGTFLDEEELKAFFAARNAEMTSYRLSERSGVTNIQIIVIAKDAAKAINAGAFGAMRLVAKEKLMQLEVPMPLKDERERHRARAEKLLPGASVTLTLNTPHNIVISNGRQLSDEMCSWHFTSGGRDSFFDAPEILFAQWKQ